MEKEVPRRLNLNVLVSDGGVKTQVQIVIYRDLKHRAQYSKFDLSLESEALAILCAF